MTDNGRLSMFHDGGLTFKVLAFILETRIQVVQRNENAPGFEFSRVKPYEHCVLPHSVFKLTEKYENL